MYQRSKRTRVNDARGVCVNRTQKTMRNSVIGLAGQIITILLSIIARKVFIQYIGVELLGLNSTFASILSTLSLAELGFQQVIVFHLYGALAKGDQKQVNCLVNVYRVVYRCIGCVFIVALLIMRLSLGEHSTILGHFALKNSFIVLSERTHIILNSKYKTTPYFSPYAASEIDAKFLSDMSRSTFLTDARWIAATPPIE